MTRSHRMMLQGVLAFVARPRTTLFCALVLCAACAILAAIRLTVSTDQNELFSPRVSFFRDWLFFYKQFPESEAIYVLIERRDAPGVPPASAIPVERWTGAADAVAARLAQLKDRIASVDAKVPLDQLGHQGLLFQEPAELRQNLADTRRFIPLVKLWAEAPSPLTALLGHAPLQRFLAGLALAPPDAETARFVRLLADSWANSLCAGKADVPDLKSLDVRDPQTLGYYYVPDEEDRSRRLVLVRVYPRNDNDTLTSISETVDAIRGAATEAIRPFPEFTAGVTGRPALDADEMRTTDRDSRRAEIIAVTGIFFGLVLLLRSVWLALAAEVTLGVGIAWTFGYATLTVGRLNLLSLVFLLALIGIGMDYLVQIIARYRIEAGRRHDARLVWIAVFRQVGAPINTACLGAAGAFFVATLTDFRGAAELGIIAGGGLILCLLAGYTFLPALLTVFPAGVTRIPPLQYRADWRPAKGWLRLIAPGAWVLLLLAGVVPALRTRFNPGLLDLQARGVPSVQLVRKLTTWFSVVLSKDLQTLRAARQAVAGSPVVDHTESILTALDNHDRLHEPANALPAIAWSEPASVETADLAALAQAATNLANRFAPQPTTRSPTNATTSPANDDLAPAAAALRAFAEQLRAAPPATAARELSDWQRSFIGELRDVLAQFDPAPLDLPRVPRELRSHLVSDEGYYALYIYPKEDLWEQASLARFVTDVERCLAPVPGRRVVTGIANDIYHTTASISRSFYTSTAYALALIFVLVWIDLRRLRDTLMAVSVLALGLPMLVALMGLLHVDWNFANFFGLPILIGAGHEYGVFMVHRFREVLHDRRRAWHGWDVADRALALCAYVTSSSFGFFWLLGHHEGLRSLGFVMAVGTLCIYLATVCVLRPLLKLRLERGGHQ